MFLRRGIFMRTFLIILLIGIFASVAGRWSYNAGWRSGYVAAQTTAQGEDGATVPSPAPRGYPAHGWGFGPIGWFFGGLFKFWLFLLLVGLSLKFLGWGLWGHRGQRRHHKRGDGPRPPWHWGHEDDVPHEKSPEDVEPDIRSV